MHPNNPISIPTKIVSSTGEHTSVHVQVSTYCRRYVNMYTVHVCMYVAEGSAMHKLTLVEFRVQQFDRQSAAHAV